MNIDKIRERIKYQDNYHLHRFGSTGAPKAPREPKSLDERVADEIFKEGVLVKSFESIQQYIPKTLLPRISDVQIENAYRRMTQGKPFTLTPKAYEV